MGNHGGFCLFDYDGVNRHILFYTKIYTLSAILVNKKTRQHPTGGLDMGFEMSTSIVEVCSPCTIPQDLCDYILDDAINGNEHYSKLCSIQKLYNPANL